MLNIAKEKVKKLIYSKGVFKFYHIIISTIQKMVGSILDRYDEIVIVNVQDKIYHAYDGQIYLGNVLICNHNKDSGIIHVTNKNELMDFITEFNAWVQYEDFSESKIIRQTELLQPEKEKLSKRDVSGERMNKYLQNAIDLL